MAEKQYLLGSDEQQAWMRDYFFAPRGIGFTEPERSDWTVRNSVPIM